MSAELGTFDFFRSAVRRSRYAHATAVAVFVLATASAAFAQNSHRPVTAALVYLLGVMIVGGLSGLWGGLMAAALASFTHNFFLSDPVFRFSLTSADEYVPLIAFNLSAAASGILTGRLKDRALAAEVANRRIRALLEVSERLQSAVDVRDIPAAIAGFTASIEDVPELYLVSDGHLIPAGGRKEQTALAEAALAAPTRKLADGHNLALRLSTQGVTRGVLVLRWPGRAHRTSSEHDLEALFNLLSITLERCLLLERLSEAEVIKRSEEFKTALLSSVSHDMRTPLSAISASASSLARFGSDLAPATRSDLLNMIQEQCDRLNRYTTNLLNLGRIQSGVDDTQFIECDVIEVLGSALSKIRNLAGDREFRKKYSVTMAPVRADPVMLEQVFYNILDNAVRYSLPGSSIAVFVRAEDEDLLVSIENEGEAIATSDLSRIFERFYRSRSAQAHEGSGLGLSIAKGFTEAFGGSISAEHADGGIEGTAIRIRLPAISQVER